MKTLSASDRNRHTPDMQVFQSATLKPPEYFFIGMLGLILRGIPVEGVQQSFLGVRIVAYAQDISQNAGQWPADTGQGAQHAVSRVDDRHGHAQATM